MKIAIHQPQYLPWLGYFDKMDQADIFVLLDDVQYKKNEWQNRNKLRNSRSWQWITVPVLYEFGERIMDVKINNRFDWCGKHAKSLEHNYSRTEHFERYFPFFRAAFKQKWELLAEINICFIRFLKDALGIKTELVRSSSLGVKDTKTERLVEICRALKADTYISGSGGSEYLDEERFSASGISLEYHDYVHPEYRQAYKGFYPEMSVVDLLFCHGGKSLSIIKEGRRG